MTFRGLLFNAYEMQRRTVTRRHQTLGVNRRIEYCIVMNPDRIIDHFMLMH